MQMHIDQPGKDVQTAGVNLDPAAWQIGRDLDDEIAGDADVRPLPAVRKHERAAANDGVSHDGFEQARQET